ncbi:branched-chain amino acid ABC transporter substrate-binding protein [Propionivibrio sp.]|uniref:branched-chain amino acid ABC transporter substrate-binding protein n=1 Tax=Propionivibrio sp. TaxID=2212460 RepID=UPI00343F1E97|nr:branched-chain amino acid ABC transporter substrate-binding protein [Propionivibrio sp.]MBK8402248.1 branched-chain amino acid ABC transporter substrate-binding protein [Propionivibrio sp.]MBK8745937.1 branched-chain amino acid ABC transporter substrate-binding protein [Propionivibrio sp.]MBK8892704.1 branched-chain amino acid ABC transporter substrate-binding protein [Propionivibrio sp.]
MSYLRISSMTLAVAAAISLIGCGQKEEPKPAPAPAPVAAPVPPPKPEVTVRLGHVAPLTGPQAHLGKDNENGARMAIDELNAQGLEIGGAKVKFDLVAEDDQADPKQGTIVAQKLVDAKVNGVIGHLNSGTTIPASKIYFDAGIPQISGSATNPKYTQQGFTTAFRVMANDVQQGKVLGEFAAHQMGGKKIAIIDDRTAYGQGLADEFEKAILAAGGKIATREFTNDKATDFAAILTKIKSKKVDVVFYGGMDAQGGPMAKQMKSLGVKAKFLTGDGGCTPEFIKLAGEASEGQFCSLPGVPLDQMPGGKAFGDAFTAKYGQIQLYAPYVYDAVMVMVDSMKRANSVESAKFLPEIGKSDYQGVSAKVQFDDKGDLKGGAISMYQVKDGKWEYRETIGGSPAEMVKEAVKDAAAAVKDAAVATGEAAKDAVKGAAMEGAKAAADVAKGAADATKSAAEATKAAVEKK